MGEATKVPEVVPAVPEVTFYAALENLPHCKKYDDLARNPKDSKLHCKCKLHRYVCADCEFEAMRISGGFMWYDEAPAQDFVEFASQPCVFEMGFSMGHSPLQMINTHAAYV